MQAEKARINQSIRRTTKVFQSGNSTQLKTSVQTGDSSSHFTASASKHTHHSRQNYWRSLLRSLKSQNGRKKRTSQISQRNGRNDVSIVSSRSCHKRYDFRISLPPQAGHAKVCIVQFPNASCRGRSLKVPDHVFF